jgi:subtilisin family serine protease
MVSGLPVDAHANVETAQELTRGEGITIAIIDDGVDIDHGEFTGKVVAPRDATLQTNDPRPKDVFGTGPENGDNHGTACAGVACANGTIGASGVAPRARLMPIRLASGLGSQREADAFKMGRRQWSGCNLLQLGT